MSFHMGKPVETSCLPLMENANANSKTVNFEQFEIL